MKVEVDAIILPATSLVAYSSLDRVWAAAAAATPPPEGSMPWR